MSLRRSERLNPGCNSELNPVKKQIDDNSSCSIQKTENQLEQEQEKQESTQERYFNSSTIQKIIEQSKKENTEEGSQGRTESDVDMAEEKPPSRIASATVKALNKMELEMTDKRKGRKSGRLPVAVKRQLLNKKLAKLLTPKSALILLHELKPNCVYKVQEQPGCIPPSFCAQVLHNDVVLGVGQGLSKSHAKNSAAENAIKTIVSNTMSQQSTKTESGSNSIEMNENQVENTPENLPWAGLASFAIYKMFSEWQAQGADLLTRPVLKPKPKPPSIPNAPIKKELPANANELHPAVVLNMVCPGLTAVEVEREDGPKCRVKMAYSLDGKMFTGIGGNKKDAKKEAAKAVLESLYGLTYPK